MKTFKLALVATLVAFALVTVANADGFKSKPKPIKVVNLSLDKAMSIPALVAVMVDQIDQEDFLAGSKLIYVATVTYNGVTYNISGTLLQWLNFFKLQAEPTVNDKEKVFGIG